MTDPSTKSPALSRRDALRMLGALAGLELVGSALPGCSGSERKPPSVETPDMPGACVLTPKQVEGPFFLNTGMERRDITGGKAGVPLKVELTITSAATCAPIPNAVVELWHADAAGVYSGFQRADGNMADSAGETFLRGYQRTDARGVAVFETIYPGWYPGRTPHLHLSVFLEQNRLITTQLYFDDAVSARVYQQQPYVARGRQDTTNASDEVSRYDNPRGTAPLLLALTSEGSGYTGRFSIGARDV